MTFANCPVFSTCIPQSVYMQCEAVARVLCFCTDAAMVPTHGSPNPTLFMQRHRASHWSPGYLVSSPRHWPWTIAHVASARLPEISTEASVCCLEAPFLIHSVNIQHKSDPVLSAWNALVNNTKNVYSCVGVDNKQ